MFRPRTMLALLGLAAALGGARTARASPQTELQRAIALYENLSYEQAAAVLRRLLAKRPARGIAAKAHLYLGLIAFDGSSAEAAAEEFKLALQANPAIELPPLTSPKARLLLAETRRELEGEVERPDVSSPPPPGAAPAPVPAEATAPVVVEAAAPTRHPRAAAIALGVVGILAAATAVYGGIQVLDWQSLVARANASPGTVAGSQLVSGHGAAQVWADAWIPAAVVSGGCFLGTAFTW